VRWWRTLCSPIKDGRAVVKWILALRDALVVKRCEEPGLGQLR
jgi:hypothetical protein